MLARKISASNGASSGRNGRSPAGGREVMPMPPREVASSPLPLVGRGRGWGSRYVALLCLNLPTPHPDPPPQGGREQIGWCGAFARPVSSRDVPGGAILGVLEHHAH